MRGDYIKIISDGTQLFIKDTECFLCVEDRYVRPTIDQFNQWIEANIGDVLGKQIIKYESHSQCRKLPIGEIVWEVDLCELTEFYFVYSTISKEVNGDGSIKEL